MEAPILGLLDLPTRQPDNDIQQTSFNLISQLNTTEYPNSKSGWMPENMPALELSDLSAISPTSTSSHGLYMPSEYTMGFSFDQSSLAEKHEPIDYTNYQPGAFSDNNGMAWVLQWNSPEQQLCDWNLEHGDISALMPPDLTNDPLVSGLQSETPNSILSPRKTRAMPKDKKRKHPTSPKIREATKLQSSAESPHDPKDITHNKLTTEFAKSSKKSHNLVEKQYRKRLNGQFAQLQAKIPRDLLTGNEGRGSGKNVTKTDTLEKAQQYIKMLQEQEQTLLRSNRELAADMERLEEQWRSSGRAPAH